MAESEDEGALGPAANEGSLMFSVGTKMSGEPITVRTYRVFVSSASDVADAREQVRRLIFDSINPTLGEQCRAQLLPMMWEYASPQVAPGNDLNQLFTPRLQGCQAVLAMFESRLGDGTKDEIDTVLAMMGEEQWPERESLATILFTPRRRFLRTVQRVRQRRRLARYLESLQARGVFYLSTGKVGTPSADATVHRILAAYSAAVIADMARRGELVDVI